MKKLFEAKGEIPVIKKDANNPFFKSGYATLSNIIETVEPILMKHGLMITHVMQGNSLLTQIWDGDKALLESRFDLPVNGDIQKIGSAITYAKRYNITAMLNLNIEDDDDGNGAKPVPKETAKPVSAYNNAVASINGAKTLDDLTVIGEKIKKSTALTAEEKEKLTKPFKTKSVELLKTETEQLSK